MITECPHCCQLYEVDDEYIDQIVECTSCGQEFVVEKIKKEDSDLPQNNYSIVSIFDDENKNEEYKVFTCEICDSTDLIKQNGFFVCRCCGTRYSAEEVKKFMEVKSKNEHQPIAADIFCPSTKQNAFSISSTASPKNDKNIDRKTGCVCIIILLILLSILACIIDSCSTRNFDPAEDFPRTKKELERAHIYGRYRGYHNVNELIHDKEVWDQAVKEIKENYVP